MIVEDGGEQSRSYEQRALLAAFRKSSQVRRAVRGAQQTALQMSGPFVLPASQADGRVNDFDGLEMPLMDMNMNMGMGMEMDMDMDMDMDMLGTDDGTSVHGGGGFTPFMALPQPGMAAPPSSNNTVQPGRGDDMHTVGTGAGAGPLPAGFGVPSTNPSGSTLTEFTKRRNWSQRVLEELRDLLHILTPNGRILYVSPSCRALTGWQPSQLTGRFINDFIHPEDIGIFVKEFNESIASGNSLRFFYRFRKADDSWAIFESHGHPHLTTDPSSFAPPNALNCRGFFIMARPYPTKNAALLDSFLEHKIENERLTKRIAELKREEQDEHAACSTTEGPSQSQGPSPSQVQSQAASQPAGPPTDAIPAHLNPAGAASYAQMPPPAKPSISNTALTRQNLDEVLAASRTENISDKMARYEGANHLETIEMLTGLRYRDGERSQGISTGDASPMLIRGDAGIHISLDRDARSSADKKKKLKLADEYVCTDCGTLDSPEWRKGPNGPKTLCNACGLRWAKKEKKKVNPNTPGHHSTSTPAGLPMHQSTGSS